MIPATEVLIPSSFRLKYVFSNFLPPLFTYFKDTYIDKISMDSQSKSVSRWDLLFDAGTSTCTVDPELNLGEMVFK